MHVCVCEVSEVYSMYAHTPQNAHRNWETHTHIRVCTSQLPVHTTRWAHDHKPLHANICKNSTYSRIRSMNMAFLYIHIYVYNTRQTFLNRDSHVCLCMWGEVHTHVCMWGESTHTNKHALVYMYPIQNLMYTQLGQSRWAHDYNPLHTTICKNSLHDHFHRICAHVIQSKSQKPLQCMGHNLWQWACLCKGASTPRRKTSRRTSFVRSSAAAFFRFFFACLLCLCVCVF